MNQAPKFKAEIALRTEYGPMIGETRIRLLEAIGRHGSIAQAAKQMPLSYKSAWDAVDDMNNLAESALVERTIGGAHGGGTRLTDHGHQLIAMFRALEGESQAAADRLAEPGVGDTPADVASLRRLLRRLAMRTSARNQFLCTVDEIRQGPVNAQVYLSLDRDARLEAQVTRDSVEQLELRRGQEVVALIKAPAIIVLPDPRIRTSASNHFSGRVSRIENGPVNSELSIDLEMVLARTATAVVTTDAVHSLGLEEGAAVGVAFAATSVLLAVMG